MLVFWTRLFPHHPLQVSRIPDIMAALRLHSGSSSLGLPQMVLKHQAAGARTFFASPSRGKQRLVILGSGWGGYEILRAIDKKRWSKYMHVSKTRLAITENMTQCCWGQHWNNI